MYFHASHIVHCLTGPIIPTDLTTFGRLSVGVNKICLFAYTNDSNTLCYQTMQWQGNSIGN